jgi:transaldolase
MQLSLKTKIFADGAEKASMLELHNNPLISGFTTNPTLMRKAGIKDYNEFAQDILKSITDKPVSFEVFSDNFDEMERQAIEIAKWGSNVIVKIPITNTKGESSVDLIRRLSAKGIKINATAMMTIDQVISVLPGLSEGSGGYVSIFAGRIADAGVDPFPIMKEVMDLLQNYPNVELIWASPRELFNIIQANEIGCHIITVTNDILKKLPTIGKDLTEFSLDTVKMFYDDASAAGYTIKYALEKVLL